MAPKRRNMKAPPYTEWHHNTLRAKKRIPQALRFHYPIESNNTQCHDFLYENLKTDDYEEGKRLAAVFVQRTEKSFARLARANETSRGQLSESYRWRKCIAPEDISSEISRSLAANAPLDAMELETLLGQQNHSQFDTLVDRAYELQEKAGHARAMRFFRRAIGQTEPISESLDEWLTAKSYSPAVAQRYRRHVLELIDWCRSHRISPCIEAITPDRADKFISRHDNRGEKTVSNERAALSSLWDWSNDRLKATVQQHVDGCEKWIGDQGDNPWRRRGTNILQLKTDAEKIRPL